MNAITSLFDTVSVNETFFIEPKHQLFCESLQKSYLAQQKHLLANLYVLREAEKQIRDIGQLKPTKKITGNCTYSISLEIEKIDQSLHCLQYEFRDQLISYFEANYQFIIDHAKVVVSDNWNEVIFSLLNECGGAFTSQAEKTLIKEFQSDCHNFTAAVLKGCSITFNKGYKLINIHGWNGPRLYEQSDNRTKTLVRVLSFFNEGRFDSLDNYTALFPSDRYADRDLVKQFPAVIQTPGNNLVKISAYKNEKTTFHFSDSSQAARFYELFLVK